LFSRAKQQARIMHLYQIKGLLFFRQMGIEILEEMAARYKPSPCNSLKPVMMHYHKSAFWLCHSVPLVFIYCFINEEREEQTNKKNHPLQLSQSIRKKA